MVPSDSRRGSGGKPSEPPLMTLGQIVRPHGVRGELRMDIHTAYPERIVDLEQIYLAPARDVTNLTPYTLVKARPHRDIVLLTLEGITDRTQAEGLRGHMVMVPLAQGAPLEDGEIYLFQLIGLKVYTEGGDYIGQIEEIIETGANDVFLLRGSELGEILIPDTDEVVLEIDLEAEKMIINPIPGLLSDSE